MVIPGNNSPTKAAIKGIKHKFGLNEEQIFQIFSSQVAENNLECAIMSYTITYFCHYGSNKPTICLLFMVGIQIDLGVAKLNY